MIVTRSGNACEKPIPIESAIAAPHSAAAPAAPALFLGVRSRGIWMQATASMTASGSDRLCEIRRVAKPCWRC